MRLALAEAYRPLWSDRVQKEWTDALARHRPDLPREKIERVRALMEQHIPEATVEDYEALVGQLTLPDDGDRHVLAAAIKGNAEILVTANLKHFPAPALAPYGIEVLHPDEFVLRLVERAPARVLAAARDHRQSLKNPAKSVEEYLGALEKLGLVGTVAALRPFAALIE
jgi:predicted nucleic acid-binding protein